jgi:hypothetical protein
MPPNHGEEPTKAKHIKWMIARNSFILENKFTRVFVALAVALCAFGLINAVALASGTWFANGSWSDNPLRASLPPQESV